jgi:hypothetical protein
MRALSPDGVAEARVTKHSLVKILNVKIIMMTNEGNNEGNNNEERNDESLEAEFILCTVFVNLSVL